MYQFQSHVRAAKSTRRTIDIFMAFATFLGEAAAKRNAKDCGVRWRECLTDINFFFTSPRSTPTWAGMKKTKLLFFSLWPSSSTCGSQHFLYYLSSFTSVGPDFLEEFLVTSPRLPIDKWRNWASTVIELTSPALERPSELI